jgi:hypothetical protein
MRYIPRSEQYNPSFKPSARHTVTPKERPYIRDFFAGRDIQTRVVRRYETQLRQKAKRASLEESLRLSIDLDLTHKDEATEFIDGKDLYRILGTMENPTLTFAPIGGVPHCLITQSDGSWKLYQGSAVSELLDIVNED